MLKHLELIPFLLAFVVGLFVITWRKPDSDQKVPKWPHPTNVGKITYRDRNGICYKYVAKEVDCTAVKSKLKEFPHE